MQTQIITVTFDYEMPILTTLLFIHKTNEVKILPESLLCCLFFAAYVALIHIFCSTSDVLCTWDLRDSVSFYKLSLEAQWDFPCILCMLSLSLSDTHTHSHLLSQEITQYMLCSLLTSISHTYCMTIYPLILKKHLRSSQFGNKELMYVCHIAYACVLRKMWIYLLSKN